MLKVEKEKWATPNKWWKLGIVYLGNWVTNLTQQMESKISIVYVQESYNVPRNVS